MSRLPPTSYRCEPCPDNPGWLTWDSLDPARFNGAAMGKLLIRQDGAETCRLRMIPGHAHANLPGSVHGGVTLALIDIALFASLWVLRGGDSAGAGTLEVHSQFIGAGELEEPLDAVTEVLRETRRLAFMRGKVVQGDQLIAAYSGTIRKAGAGR
ncbi:MAG TPA: PaaI family thioesterase [Novosphingobium sp.]|nr:PaaI family thioesterase [Novosphingobium sp.]